MTKDELITENTGLANENNILHNALDKMNITINELHNKLDAQDKIINTQALEIAKLNKLLNCKERLTKIMPPDTEFIILSKSDYERQEKDIEEIALELRDKIDKAIDYIKWQYENPTYDNVWRKYEVEKLLEILGDKENE